MAYALVSFAFIGGAYDKKKYLFKTDIKGLVRGDVVEVEGRNEGETTIAVFSKYVAEDRLPGHQRKVLKKVHKNILKSVMKQRVELFERVIIPKRVYPKYYKAFKNDEGLSNDEVRAKIVRHLSVAAYRYSPQKNTERYFSEKMHIVVKNGVLQNIVQNEKNVKWIRPNILDEIAELYIEQFVTK
ncbi:hypothetical protein ACIQXI_21660 [Lysinibacillus sp. NPDC097195]|uniref:hypothetical protein n=1 Tax=Lysinibacillus sp. NPDC097195 TaxID=3364141 RepID=UPI003823E59D